MTDKNKKKISEFAFLYSEFASLSSTQKQFLDRTMFGKDHRYTLLCKGRNQGWSYVYNMAKQLQRRLGMGDQAFGSGGRMYDPVSQQAQVAVFATAFTRLVENIVPELEKYRQKNVDKYHAEDALDFKEYTKLERYKNRVRVVDSVLPGLRQFLVDSGMLRAGDQDQTEIP